MLIQMKKSCISIYVHFRLLYAREVCNLRIYLMNNELMGFVIRQENHFVIMSIDSTPRSKGFVGRILEVLNNTKTTTRFFSYLTIELFYLRELFR